MLRSCKAPQESFDFTLPPSFSDNTKLQNQRCNFPQFGRHLVLIFVQIRVYSFLSVSISPRTLPLSGKKNPTKTKALPENRYTDPTTPLYSISILLAQGQKKKQLITVGRQSSDLLLRTTFAPPNMENEFHLCSSSSLVCFGSFKSQKKNCNNAHFKLQH